MRLLRPLALVLALVHAAPAPAQEPAALPAAADVVLMPGDALRVQIWREQDLSGEFPVEPDGDVVLPLLGERRVAGIPMGEVREGLLSAYAEHLRNPSIAITPLRRVNVLGEVYRAGMYPVDPTVSLAGAMAVAGGATPVGDLRRIRIVRDGEVIRARIGIGETLAGADIRSGDQIIVERRSWFDRNSTFLVSALLSATSIVSSIIIASTR